MIRDFILALIIISATIGALLLTGVLVATFRRIMHGKQACDVLWTQAAVAGAEAKSAQEGWGHRILVAFDQFINVLVFRGWPDETISAHSERAAVHGKLWGRILVWWLDLIEVNHGQKAESGDAERAEAVEHLEDGQLGVQDK